MVPVELDEEFNNADGWFTSVVGLEIEKNSLS